MLGLQDKAESSERPTSLCSSSNAEHSGQSRIRYVSKHGCDRCDKSIQGESGSILLGPMMLLLFTEGHGSGSRAR